MSKDKTYKQIIAEINKKDKIVIDWFTDQDGIVYLKLKGFSFPFISVIPATPLSQDYKNQISEMFKSTTPDASK